VAVRSGRSHTSSHRGQLSLPFQSLGGPYEQPPTGRGHVVVFPAQAASSLIPSVKLKLKLLQSTVSSANFRTSFAPLDSSARCATTPPTTYGLHHVNESPADHVDWHQTGSLSPKPSLMPCCAMALLAAPRVLGLPYYTLCLRTMGRIPAMIQSAQHLDHFQSITSS
jgi:hypothetical protein